MSLLAGVSYTVDRFKKAAHQGKRPGKGEWSMLGGVPTIGCPECGKPLALGSTHRVGYIWDRWGDFEEKETLGFVNASVSFPDQHWGSNFVRLEDWEGQWHGAALDEMGRLP